MHVKNYDSFISWMYETLIMQILSQLYSMTKNTSEENWKSREYKYIYK